MRNRFSKKLNTQIELTSLLDVIFIVLMVVICNQQINMTAKANEAQVVMQQAEDMKAEAEDIKAEAEDIRAMAEDTMAEAEAQKELIKEHKDTYESINEVTEVMTVYVTYTPSNPEDRGIRVLAGDEELPRIQLSPSNQKDALERFEDMLDKRISEARKADKPVIISINKDQILYRDEKAVSQIMDRLFEKYDNIYYKKSGN